MGGTHEEPGRIQILQPQPCAGGYPQYVAPELWSDNATGTADSYAIEFDGYAADLWSAGVMLLAMLVGTDALFVAPVAADPVFRRICTGGLKKYVAKTQKKKQLSTNTATTSGPISEEAIDLLQRMLRVDPRERLMLADVQQHPWVRSDE